jgi:TolB-like protein/tetratricopeptide (TPR) repeat protein
MSDDPQQEYFSDGISEDIITALSKTSKMFVIARNSTFAYKGKAVNVQEIGRDLGVHFVLEGSVRKVGEEARITAQLIDAQTGHHLWAEKYDRDLKDIFDLQDEITKKIITELHVELTEGEQARIFGKGTEDLELYLKCLEARSLIQQHNIEDNHKGRLLLEEAIAIDPNYAPAYRWLGVTHFADVFLGASKSKGDSLNKAIELSKKAISIDNFYGDAYGLLGFLYVLKRQYDVGNPLLEKALELDPNGSDNNTYLAASYLYLDDLEKALSLQKKAIRLNPISPSLDLNILAAIYRSQGDYNEALIWSQKAVQTAPKHTISRVNLCSILVLNGRLEEARLQANKVKELNPKFSVNKLEKTLPYKNQEVKRIYIDALRKSGLPD